MEQLSTPQPEFRQPTLDQALLEQTPEVRATTGSDGRVRFSEHGIGEDGKATSRFMSRDEVNQAFAGFNENEQTTEVALEQSKAQSGSYEPKHLAQVETADVAPETSEAAYVPKHLQKQEQEEAIPEFLDKHFNGEELPDADIKQSVRGVLLGERDARETGTDGLIEELPALIQKEVVRTPEEQTAKQLDNNLRRMISDYRKLTAKGLTIDQQGAS